MTVSLSASMHLETLQQNASTFAEPDLLQRPYWSMQCKEKNQAHCPPATCCHRVNRQEQHRQRWLRQPFSWLSWAQIASTTWHFGQHLNPEKLLYLKPLQPFARDTFLYCAVCPARGLFLYATSESQAVPTPWATLSLQQRTRICWQARAEHCSHRRPRGTRLTAFGYALRWTENMQNDPTFTWKAKATWWQWLFKVSHSCNSAVAARKTHMHGI